MKIKKPSIALVASVAIVLGGCSLETQNFVCKNTEQESFSLSLKSDIATSGGSKFRLCRAAGNIRTYSPDCTKTEFGFYPYSFDVDIVSGQFWLKGSGGVTPISVASCARIRD